MIKQLSKYIEDIDEDGYVPFNADRSLGQNQYAARYIAARRPELNVADLGKGLRWKNLEGNYHDIMIHIDDLLTFHARYEEYEKKRTW